MFDNLDDPTPGVPAPIDSVVERGRQLRNQRRMLVGAVAMLLVAGAITTAAALQDNGHAKVVISNESTSTVETTVPATDTSVADTTTTTNESSTTVVVTPTTGTPTPTSTQPPHDPRDLSQVTVSYPDTYGPSTCQYASGVQFSCPHLLAIDSGQSEMVQYTATNNGTWTVDLGECATRPVDVWSDILRAGQGPSSEGIWPQPYPSVGSDAVPEGCAGIGNTLAPGESVTLYSSILAGYRNAAGDVMPAPPGIGSFVPSFLPQCAQPCDTYPPNSLAISIWPPNESEPVAYTFQITTMHVQAASGASAPVELLYTNPLGFSVRMPVLGPCWTVKSGSAQVDCSGARPEVVVGPHATVDLVGTIWARKGFTPTGTPLAPGDYGIDLGDRHGSLYPAPVGPDFPDLTVTP